VGAGGGDLVLSKHVHKIILSSTLVHSVHFNIEEEATACSAQLLEYLSSSDCVLQLCH